MATIAKPLIEFKGSLFTLPIIRITTSHLDLAKIGEQLTEKIKQSPRFFQNAPLVIDLNHLAQLTAPELRTLLALLKQHHLVPIGVQCQNEEIQKIVLAEELAVMPTTKHSPLTTPAVETQPRSNSKTSKTKVITQPVRSGQQVLAAEGDLLILNSVSPGAEILATGNIHVYGPLRGRALAGIHGDETARIFCHQLDAELISIAGHYQANEKLIATPIDGKIVHIYLQNERLHVDII